MKQIQDASGNKYIGFGRNENRNGKRVFVLTALLSKTTSDVLNMTVPQTETIIEEDIDPNCTLCNKDYWICLIDKKATYSLKATALNKICLEIPKATSDALCQELYGYEVAEINAFLEDLLSNSTLGENVGNLTPTILATWHYLYTKHATNAENARKDWNTLLQFGKLNDRAKQLVVLFSDGDTKRLINFCVDLPKTHKGLVFLDFVNDVKNDKYVRGFVKKNLSEEDQQDLEGILADWTKQNDENPEVQKWLLYGENSTRFQRNRTLGNDLSTNILAVFKNKTMPYYENWGKALGFNMDLAKNLDGFKDYVVLDEIPLNTSGGFMKADILLLKRNITNENVIDDVIIIENKLSQNTDLTDRQVEGFGAILKGQTSMIINYTRQGLIVGSTIPVSGGVPNLGLSVLEKIEH